MHPLIHFESIDSTNEYLKREYPCLEDQTVVVADHQTKGKGRRGRSWTDDSKSLVFSLLLKKDINSERIDLLPLLSGIAISQMLDDLDIPSLIKWPNDVLIQEKKCSGILLEAVTEESIKAVIIGIGINLNDQEFPSDIREKAISLAMASKREYDSKRILTLFLNRFDALYSMYQNKDDSYLDILRKRSYLTGKKVRLDYYGENIEATVIDILANGHLLLNDGKKDIEVNAGEVSLQTSYGM